MNPIAWVQEDCRTLTPWLAFKSSDTGNYYSIKHTRLWTAGMDRSPRPSLLSYQESLLSVNRWRPISEDPPKQGKTRIWFHIVFYYLVHFVCRINFVTMVHKDISQISHSFLSYQETCHRWRPNRWRPKSGECDFNYHILVSVSLFHCVSDLQCVLSLNMVPYFDHFGIGKEEIGFKWSCI